MKLRFDIPLLARDLDHPEANLEQRVISRVMEHHLPKAIIDKVNVWSSWFVYAIWSSLLCLEIWFVNKWFPGTIPFTFWELWQDWSVSLSSILHTWPVFLWGIGVTTYYSYHTQNEPHENRYAERYLTKGFAISLLAGVCEEIVFRWLLFFVAIATVCFLNWCTFGLWAWFYGVALGPVADFFTGHYLHHILFNYNGYGWAVGSAVIYSNSRFRDGHKYQGLTGLINSWFIGMCMFYIMFEHGLLTAIVTHFLYDMFIFAIRYIDAAIERRQGLY
jgi:hypothetical protein